ELLTRSEDVHDPHIPLLLWWAVESKAVSDRDAVLSLLDPPDRWRLPLVRQALTERIGRRYLAGGTETDYQTCARLIRSAPSPKEREVLVRGMEQALVGRRLEHVPTALEQPLADLERELPRLLWLRFAVRLGDRAAYRRLLNEVADA